MPRRLKNLLGTFEEEGKTFSCSRWESWPPADILAYKDCETVREVKGNEAYARARVWEQACGLLKMDPAKCVNCPYVLADGKAVVKQGSQGRPPRTVAATRMAQEMKRLRDEE